MQSLTSGRSRSERGRPVSWLSSLFTRQASAEGEALFTAAFGDARPLDRTSAEMLREYVRNIYLWRSVDMIAQMSSAVALEVHSEGGQLSLVARQVAALMRRPNPQWTAAALQYFVAASLAITNRAFLKRVRGVGDITQELWPINADDVTVKYVNGSKMIAGFEIAAQQGREREYFPVNEKGV